MLIDECRIGLKRIGRPARLCGACPKRDEHGTCRILAKFVSEFQRSCWYGRKAMNQAYMREYARAKRAQAKRGETGETA